LAQFSIAPLMARPFEVNYVLQIKVKKNK